MTVLVVAWGASPGIGKSTLCAGLSEWLSDAGLQVDHFQEEEILTRPQYADVASHFLATGEVEREALLLGYRPIRGLGPGGWHRRGDR